MRRYDPNVAPDPVIWLSLDEALRLQLVQAYHSKQGGFGQNLALHSAMHTVVENQVAMREPVEAAAALQRLTGAGLSRHDAVHALGYALADHIFPILKARDAPPPFDLDAYCTALRELTVAAWLGHGRR